MPPLSDNNYTRAEFDSLTANERFELVYALKSQLIGFNHLMAEIPPCPDHGQACVPHAVKWIIDTKQILNTV